MELTQATAAEPAPPRHGPSIRWLPLLAVLIFVVYPLSAGPIYKLVDKDIVPRGALAIYKPLETAATIIPGTGAALDWYIFQVWKVAMVD
jgi:hypothetical protein